MAELPRLRVGLSLDSATFVAETRKVGAAVNQMGASVNQQMVALNKGFSTATASAEILRHWVREHRLGISSNYGGSQYACMGGCS